jgi:hypothetical protein
MNLYLVAAASLAFLVGLIHSILGEKLIFFRLRRGELVPTDGGSLLQERHVRIVWASWHVLTVLGWCIAYVLWTLADPAAAGPYSLPLLRAITTAMVVSAAFVLYGTRGRHPGWIGLLGVALLTSLGA